MTLSPKILYFGSLSPKRSQGHVLYLDENTSVGSASALFRHTGIRVNDEFFRALDGAFLPIVAKEQGVFKWSVVQPFSIISWNDFTADQRPNSHSTFLGFQYYSFVPMMAAIEAAFPSVIARQTVIPLKGEIL